MESVQSLQYIKGVGPKRAEALVKEGILLPRDLMLYFPRSYIDRNTATSIASLTKQILNSNQKDMFDNNIILYNEFVIIARVYQKQTLSFSNNRKMLKLTVRDNSGVSNIIFWNRIQYFEKIYENGQLLLISGKPELDKYGILNFSHPDIDIIDNEDEQLYQKGVILPKYRISENMANCGLNIKSIRQIISNIIDKELPQIVESLPDYILDKYKFPEIKNTIKNIHFPESRELLEKSRHRVKFEEILYFLLHVELTKQRIKFNDKGFYINPKSKSARTLFDNLPFKLTADQKKVIREVAEDIESGKPMNRLLQGDVGSGKTIVALLTILMVIDAGFQVAFMAPTEILAEQHYLNIKNLLKDLDIEIVQLVGGQKTKARRIILEKIADGTAKIVIGTHALFQSEVKYNNLAYIIIDEQHRFGVQQRADLIELAKASFDDKTFVPHILVMSATPIPRTLTMTAYGDLDVSVIKTLPKNRKPIITKIMFESNLNEIYDFVRQQIKKGFQIYIVYPLVEKSEKMALKAATEHYEFLSTEIFKEYKCGLLHGQMFWYEKEDAMKQFLNKEFDILISTTVIEVGIDVPNANLMIIENAERFGLSQLHQLRGRVGRGGEQSYCILVTKDDFKYPLNSKTNIDDSKAVFTRLKTMAETVDGFKIAEVDMKLRGPGDIMGTKQSGLPEFKFIDLVNDSELIASAKKMAEFIIQNDKFLEQNANQILKDNLQKYVKHKTYFDIA